MMTVQKVVKAYNSTMNLNERGRSFEKKSELNSAAAIKAEEKEVKRNFDSILEKAIKNSEKTRH